MMGFEKTGDDEAPAQFEMVVNVGVTHEPEMRHTCGQSIRFAHYRMNAVLIRHGKVESR